MSDRSNESTNECPQCGHVDRWTVITNPMHTRQLCAQCQIAESHYTTEPADANGIIAAVLLCE